MIINLINFRLVLDRGVSQGTLQPIYFAWDALCLAELLLITYTYYLITTDNKLLKRINFQINEPGVQIIRSFYQECAKNGGSIAKI